MKTKTKIINCQLSIVNCLLMLLMMSVASMNAQVTIGSMEDPHPGAILDLQSNDRGLKLPNVSLNDVDVFGLPVTEVSTEVSAMGMVVYNTNEATIGGNGKGLYIWEGKWIFAGKSAPVENPVERIEISSGDIFAVNAGSTLQLTATVEPVTASNKTLNWSVVYSPATTSGKASIDQTGKITAVKPGNVTVRASATDGSGVYQNFAFTIRPSNLATGIAVSSVTGATSVKVSSLLELEAIITPITAEPFVEWSVDAGGEAYAQVSSVGIVAGIDVGSATIRAKTIDGTELSDDIEIMILPGETLDTTPEEIGGITYKTYSFGGTRWMVENLRGGSPSAEYYGTNENLVDYYYTYADALAACIAPWALPTEAQILALYSYLRNQASTLELYAWNGPGATHGRYHGTQSQWVNWGETGMWWGFNLRLISVPYMGKPTSTVSSTTNVYWIPVRCVKN
jgi:uncharacterized protein (TIGR02145 family)